MHNIAIVDDHVLLRQGLVSLIENSGRFRVLFEADNGKDFINKLIPSALPELVLMDISMPLMNGFETTYWLKVNYPSIQVLALSMMDDEQSIIKVLRNGAKGYVLKNTKPQEFLSAIDHVINKGFYFNDLVSSKLIKSINAHDELVEAAAEVTLTTKEKDILCFLCSEDSYKDIGDKIGLSPRTIEGYKDTLSQKIGVKTRIGLVMYAIKNGIYVG
jgi:DNA-binding NarL/FixJ family response regulator